MALNALFCCFKKHAQKSTEPEAPQTAVRQQVVRRAPEPKSMPRAAPKSSTNGSGIRAGGRAPASRPPRVNTSTSSIPAPISSDYMLYIDFGGTSHSHHISHGGGHCGGHSSYDSGGGGYSGGGDSGGGGSGGGE